MKVLSYLLLGLAAAMFATSCDDIFSDDPYDFSGVILGQESQGSEVTSADLHRIEVPALQPGILFLAHSDEYQEDSVMTYCVGYDTVRMHSQWVAFRFDRHTRQQNVSRSNEPFMDDPSLPARYYVGASGFGSVYRDTGGNLCDAAALQPTHGVGFDRGHLCASADRYSSAKANEQTFYMTNMSPQLSAFNQRYWTAYEAFVQARGRDASFADTLYVVKGGTIRSGQTLGTIARPNGAEVTIPAYYFMALLYQRNSTWGAIAFLVEHRDYGVRNTEEVTRSEMASRAISIDELEDFTGIDFFANLPDVVETAVEASFSLSDWKL